MKWPENHHLKEKTENKFFKKTRTTRNYKTSLYVYLLQCKVDVTKCCKIRKLCLWWTIYNILSSLESILSKARLSLLYHMKPFIFRYKSVDVEPIWFLVSWKKQFDFAKHVYKCSASLLIQTDCTSLFFLNY